jgi:hypothetical protein
MSASAQKQWQFLHMLVFLPKSAFVVRIRASRVGTVLPLSTLRSHLTQTQKNAVYVRPLLYRDKGPRCLLSFKMSNPDPDAAVGDCCEPYILLFLERCLVHQHLQSLLPKRLGRPRMSVSPKTSHSYTICLFSKVGNSPSNTAPSQQCCLYKAANSNVTSLSRNTCSINQKL